MSGNGGLAVFTGDIHQTTRKLDSDIVNSRANAVNRVSDLSPGVGDIGQVRYRVPLKLDQSMERNQREIIAAVEGNPLMQSIHKNAEHDEALYKEMLKGM